MKEHSSTKSIFLLILLIGILLRVFCLKQDLPAVFHPDEHFLVYYAMENPTRMGNPEWFGYPSFCIYLLTFVYSIWFFIARIFGSVASPGEFYSWFQNNPTPFYLIARTITLFWAVLTMLILYVWGKKEKGEKWGLVIATVLSVAYLHLHESIFATVDVPLTFFMTAASFCLYQMVKTKNEKFKLWKINLDWFTASIILSGIATGCKYNGFLLIFGIFTAIYLTFPKGKFFIKSLLSIFAVVFVFLLTTPYALFDFSTFLQDMKYQVYSSNNSGMLFNAKEHWWYYFESAYGFGLGWILGLVGFVGFFSALFKKKKEDIPLLVWFGIFLLWLIVTPRGWVRWGLPLVPLLIFWGLRWVYDRSVVVRRSWLFLILFMNLVLGFFLTISLEEKRPDFQVMEAFRKPAAEQIVVRGAFGPDVGFLKKTGFEVITDKSLLSERWDFDENKPFQPSPPDLVYQGKEALLVFDEFSYAPILSGKLIQEHPWLNDYRDWWLEMGLEEKYLEFKKVNLEEVYAPFRDFSRRGPQFHVIILPSNNEESF